MILLPWRPRERPPRPATLVILLSWRPRKRPTYLTEPAASMLLPNVLQAVLPVLMSPRNGPPGPAQQIVLETSVLLVQLNQLPPAALEAVLLVLPPFSSLT